MTLPPPTRFGGSATLMVSSLGVRSIPSSVVVNFSTGFFLAFMILGNEAYRGSKERRSTECDKMKHRG